MANISIHGVYAVRAPQPCFIVELSVFGLQEEMKLSGILYDADIPGIGIRTQAPFNEHFISLDGKEILGNHVYGWRNPEVWKNEVRIVFLMHFLKPRTNLRTIYGDIEIPPVSKRPDRLKTIKYVCPY